MAAAPKTSARKAPARKAAVRKAPASKTTSKAPARTTTSKAPAHKATVRKAAASKTAARKAPATKATTRKAPATKATARKASVTRNVPAKAAKGPDAISLLTADHRTVAKLFDQLLGTGDSASKKRTELVHEIVRELSIHASIEETAFYPFARQLTKDIEKDVLEALEEHHVVKWVLNELSDLDAGAERFIAKATVLKEIVEHHVEEEESDLFPKVRKASNPRDLTELGRTLDAAKSTAPTRPHPKAADTPPANIASPAIGLVDRVRDKLSGR